LYVGFYVPKGTPFMKSIGRNEIEAQSKRSGVRCWFYGTKDGTGKIITEKHDNWNFYNNW